MLTALLLVFALEDPAATPPAEVVAPTAVTMPAVTITAAAEKAVADAMQAPPTGLPTFVPSLAPFDALRFVWREHPSIRAGRNFRLDLTMKYQEDGSYPGDHPTPFPTWQMQKLRFGIEGEIFRHIQFQVEREQKSSTSNPEKSHWKDVYVETDYLSKAQVRVGRFKIPFGLDASTGDTNLDFIFRSLAGEYLANSRDIGAMVHGRFFKRGLNYWVGGFQHDGDNAKSSKIVGADLTGAGRVSFVPFRKLKGPWAGIEIGTDFTLSKVSDKSSLPNGLRGRTDLSQYTFFESVFVKGQRRRMGVDVDWSGGPFGAQAEYIQVNDTRDAQGLGNENLSDAVGRGWYAVGTAVLTGEKKSGGVVPKKGGLGRGGIGAVEVGARYEELRFDSKVGEDTPFRNSRAETILPSGDRVWTLGVNYYLNRWVKLQLNGIRDHMTDPERDPVANGAAFWSKVVRLQFEL